MALINTKKEIIKKRLNKYFKTPYIKKYSPITKNLGGYAGRSGNTGYGGGNSGGFSKYSQAAAGLGFNAIADRLERMSEYAVMDYNAEIYAALDIYCLAEDTIIPTLDGKSYTIKELSKKEEPFYVYSSDGKNIVPAKCISAHITGKTQPVYKVTLDDGTEIEATSSHKFMMRNGEYKELKDLHSGDSLMPLYRKTSSKDDGDRITGYEMVYLSDDKKWEYTHRLVKEEFLENERGVCHHIDFNKLNNIPENIKIMSWSEHQLYHSSLNSFKWKNDKEYAEKMATIFSNHAKEMWKNEEFRIKFKQGFYNYFENLTDEDRKKYANIGDKNGMYNNGYKLKGNKNGRWKEENHIYDINLYNDIIRFVTSTKSRSKNIISEFIYKTLNKSINKKFIKDNSNGRFSNLQELINYLVPKRLEFIPRRSYRGKENPRYNSNITIDVIIEESKRCNSIKQLCENLNCDFKLISRRCKENNIQTSNLICYNHKIKSIEFSRYVDVYDLTVEKYHNFAVGDGKNGYVIVHNSDDSTTRFIDSNVLKINTQNEDMKSALDDLYFGVLNINFSLWGWIRDTLKYGDNFLLLDLNLDEGVGGILPLSVYEVERVEDVFDEENPVKFLLNNNTNREFNIYEVVHFRMFGDMAYRPYGCSILEPCRRYWRQCLLLTTNVWTLNGYKQIKDLKIGDTVYSFDNNSKQIIKSEIKDIYSTGKKQLYEIKTKHRKIYATENHRLLIKNNEGNFIYKKVKNLIINKDQLIMPVIKDGKSEYILKLNSDKYMVKFTNKNKIIDYSNYSLKELSKLIDYPYDNRGISRFLTGKRKISYNHYLKLKEIFNIEDSDIIFSFKETKVQSLISNNFEFIVDKEFVRFFGFMLGYGWLEKNRIVSFALGEYEDINDRYINYIKKLGLSFWYLNSKNSKSKTIKIGHKELWYIMKQLEFCTGFDKKIIPNWIFELNQELRIEFIKGLYDAEGSKDTGGNEGRIRMSNKVLMESLQQLCYLSGIPTGELKKTERTGGDFINGIEVKNRVPSYSLYIRFNNIKDDYFTETINSITIDKIDDTYDLEIDNKSHNFIADGLVSHNSNMLEDAMIIYRIMRCLHGDTQIWTDNGYSKIKDIKIGDKVYSYDKKNNKLILSSVKNFLNNGNQKIWETKSANYKLKSNFNHPILVKDIETDIIDYIQVDKLIPNKYQFVIPKDKIIYYETIISINPIDEYSDVFDIEVDSEFHNFIADGCVVHNSPERRVIYVDVANLPPEAVEGYVSDVMNSMKNTPIDTNNSGNFDYRLNVMSMMDDYVIPVRGKDSGTRIDTLKSAKSLTDMEDIRYIQNKLVTSLKVPKRYLGLDNESNTDLKNAAAQEDIRFSRTIERIQGMIISELKKIGITHLILKGFDPEKADQFELELKNPSSASEVEKLEVVKQKFGIAADILEGKLADRQWVYDNILQFTNDEIKLINDGLIKDFKYMAFVNSFAKTATKKYEQEFEKKFNVEKPEDALAGQMGGAPGAIPADAASDENEDVDVSGDFKNMNIGGGNSVAHRLGAKSPTSTILRPYESKSIDKISKNNKLLEENKKKDLLISKLVKKNEEIAEENDEIKERFNLD